MEENTTKSTGKLHPALWVAAIAISIFSLVGIAALTGVLPSASSKAEAEIDPFAPPVAVTPPAPAPVHVAPKPIPKTTPAPVVKTEPPPPVAKPVCNNCGTITAIKAVKVDGEGTGLGAIAGGVLGGVVGNQIGKGHGRDAARIVGIAGGAYAGHQIEKSQRSTTHFDFTVRMDNGSIRHIRQEHKEGLAKGDKVRIEGGDLEARY